MSWLVVSRNVNVGQTVASSFQTPTLFLIAKDLAHSQSEDRFYCFGMVNEGVLTVRFTYRAGVIRIFGAGYWRKGKMIYEQQNQIHE